MTRRFGSLALVFICSAALPSARAADSGVSVLVVDTDRRMSTIDRNIYGHFLEEINHSVVDGLFAEQIRGAGFEGKDYETYWTAFGAPGTAGLASVPFQRGASSVRLAPRGAETGVRQDRIYLEQGRVYDGSLWIKIENGAPRVFLRAAGADGSAIASVPLAPAKGSAWQEVAFSFLSTRTDRNASIEIGAAGRGVLLVDFVSLMQADVRTSGAMRPDLLQALRDLAPPFIRWPGGSFASTYRWKDGIGPRVSRVYHPNDFWGGYSDYYGFGTDEFLELTRQLGSDPLIVLPAPDTSPAAVEYAMDWVRYVNDPVTTESGRRRAANGHPEPYRVKYFQIDNEPMNNGFTAESYAEIVNVYGRRIREIDPDAVIVACGQKRSNDMAWSRKVIDIAGGSFDVLGVHNYEYESDRFQAGVDRIGDYLVKLGAYVRQSAHPAIRLAVLEWNLSRTYDWRAGLHAAGSLILYETLGPELTMTAPALLMRNTSDDPTWTSFIYHDHVSWFPGAAYVVEKLFRAHYAEHYLAASRGTFRDLPKRDEFFTEISTMKPEAWRPGTVDAIATASADRQRIVLKAVNYDGEPHTLLARLEGSHVPDDAAVRVFMIAAAPADAASLEAPDRIAPIESTMTFSRDLTVKLAPYSVVLVEIAAR